MRKTEADCLAYAEFFDQFCTLQLAYEMIIDSDLLKATTNMYDQLNGSNKEWARLKLKDLYYTPNTIIELSESEVLKTLVTKFFAGSFSLSALSQFVMNDECTLSLIDFTAGSDPAKRSPEVEISLILGNASYRCAFSDLSSGIDFTAQTVLQEISECPDLDRQDCRILGGVIHKIASNLTLRDGIQEQIKKESELEIEKLLNSVWVDVANDFQANDKTNQGGAVHANSDATKFIAKMLMTGGVDKLTTFLGCNIYAVSW